MTSFQVVPELQALIVESDNAAQLLQLVPDSFELAPGFVGMPHTVESVARLARMGVVVDSPIQHYYQWPRERTKIPQPFKHQIETASFAVSNPHGFILNDMGTGKSLTAAWSADYLMSTGQAHRALIVAPLSTLERVWGDTLFMHFTHRTFAVLHGSADKRKKLLAQPKDFYLINHDGLAVIAKELAARTDIDIVILDEVAAYRNSRTSKWKVLNTLLYPADQPAKRWVWGLTGTPLPNSPEDAFGQCRLVTPTSVPRHFTMWRNMVMNHTSMYVWIPRPEALDIVYKAMQPAIRFKRGDCLDLPPTLYSTRDVVLSDDQIRHLKELMRELMTEIEGHRITAVNEGVKISKALQLVGGCAYDSAGEPHEIDTGSRMETLMEVIEEAGGKILVFCSFTSMTGMIARELSKHWETAIVTGDTPVKERNEIFLRFEDEASTLEIIVAHPGTMSHGLNLVAASVVVWWTPIDSNDLYTQACARVARPGQKRTTCVINLSGSAVERKIYKRLQERQNTQGILLDMVEKGASIL